MQTDWIPLTNEDKIDTIISESHQRPQIIFKHSIYCSVSSRAYQRLSSMGSEIDEKADIHYLDVINSRPVSIAVAERFRIPHESPQLLIISNEEVILHKSHGAVQEDAVMEALKMVIR